MHQRRTNTSITIPVRVFHAVCGLPPSEAKLLLYVLWQTWGQKHPREISLTQFEHGLDGDPGTGLRRPTISQGLKKLEARGLIHIQRQRMPGGAGRIPTSCYSLTESLLRRRETA
jgi:DNA-binding transcriptional ArsR family regulator